MGIDYDTKLFFGYIVNNDLALKWLQKCIKLDEEGTDEEGIDEEADKETNEGEEKNIDDVYELLDYAYYKEIKLTEDYYFKVDYAYPYYDSGIDDSTFFFGIVFSAIDIEDMEILTKWKTFPTAENIKSIAAELGSDNPDCPQIHSLTNIH